MKLSYLEPARDHEVAKYFEDNLQLTPYQKQKLYSDELIRFAPFNFYKRKPKVTSSVLWRLTVILIPFYYIIMFCILPINMIINGQWGFGRKFIDGFHSKWMTKLNLPL